MTPTCPECGGSGEIVLLTSRRPCKACAARRAEGAAVVPLGTVRCVAILDHALTADEVAAFYAGKVNAGSWPVAPP